jgi:hypothetical protein
MRDEREAIKTGTSPFIMLRSAPIAFVQTFFCTKSLKA